MSRTSVAARALSRSYRMERVLTLLGGCSRW
jgi:hypothetical protein